MSTARPDWVKDAEYTPDGTLLIVEGTDGKWCGVRIPSEPIRPIRPQEDT